MKQENNKAEHTSEFYTYLHMWFHGMEPNTCKNMNTFWDIMCSGCCIGFWKQNETIAGNELTPHSRFVSLQICPPHVLLSSFTEI